MIVILATPSFHVTLLEKLLVAQNQEVVPCTDLATALALNPDMIMGEASLCEADALPENVACVSIGEVKLDHPKVAAHLDYPISKADVEALFAPEDSMFDPQVQSQILELLGAERYQASIDEIIGEIEAMMGAFEGYDLTAQISAIHKASGACAMLGVKGLHEPLLQAELVGKQGDSQAFAALWQSFVDAWPERQQAMRTELDA